MPILRLKVTQGGADTFTQTTINTDLTADGKSAWQFTKMKAFWENGYTAAATDQTISAILSTQATTVTVPTDPEEIARVTWAIANTAGVAVAYPVELIKQVDVPMDRITVQPTVYVSVSSTTTGLTNVVYFELEYEVVKLSDIEVLRLLVGGS